jgi:hypothetical protein
MSNLQPPTPRLTEPLPPMDGQGPDTATADPLNPETLRIGVTANIEVEQVLTAVPVRKPKRTEFFRVHPAPEYTVDTYLLERDTGMDTDAYLVAPEFQHLVLSELRQVRLLMVINKRGTVFLWPIKLPNDDNDRIRRIADTALQCAEQAKTLWVKMHWERDLGGYEMQRAKGELGEPQWPEKSFRDLLEIAFRQHLIDRPDHPVIRELAGEI